MEINELQISGMVLNVQTPTPERLRRYRCTTSSLAVWCWREYTLHTVHSNNDAKGSDVTLLDRVAFTKLHAGGNDFICMDNTQGAYQSLLSAGAWPVVVRALCRRALGVGADGLVVACQLGSGDGVDIVARFLEPDGTEARLCGNGTACFTYWALGAGLVSGPEVNILTAAGTARAQPDASDPSRVTVCVPNPHSLEIGVELNADGRHRTVHLINTGVPHAVIFVDSLHDVDVARVGAAIRWHERFTGMGGVNVNFVRILEEGHVAVRTYEFGVEAETLACGTGSTAAAIIATLARGWAAPYHSGNEPVKVEVRGGETLRVWFTHNADGSFRDTCMQTRVSPIYDGELRPEAVRELCEQISQSDR
ncbi:MAG: diaminopimelate epimerase [Lentisphaeria bacterium]|nr:diaminopimelate epimerase [Lentisphaeria bacterium]